jgi:hypothetical protein
MTHRWLPIVSTLLLAGTGFPALLVAQTERGPYARIAILRPPRAEFTTVELESGTAKAFEAALSTHQSTLQGETLWFRMVAGAAAPRYVRIRARPSLAAILDERGEQSLPDKVNDLIAKTTIEIVNLRPTMSYNLEPPARQLSRTARSQANAAEK